MTKRFLTMMAAASMVAAPTMAAAAQATPAATLSLAKNVRANSPAGSDKLSGGVGFIGIAIGAALVALITVAIIDDDDNSDSN